LICALTFKLNLDSVKTNQQCQCLGQNSFSLFLKLLFGQKHTILIALSGPLKWLVTVAPISEEMRHVTSWTLLIGFVIMTGIKTSVCRVDLISQK